MPLRMSRKTLGVATVATLSAALLVAWGVSAHAVIVHAIVNPGSVFPASNMLGPPEGGGVFIGGFDVYSTGPGGSVELEVATSIYDGPGCDFVVYENPFTKAGTLSSNWVEALYVGVSTDGVNYARFPSEYSGPVGPHENENGLDDTAEYEWFRGLAGVSVVTANPGEGVDPFHLVEGLGDAFDLQELQDHPAVLAGDVNLFDIRYIRLTDVVGGQDVDSQGTPIWDCGSPFAAVAEIDAITGLNTVASVSPDRPSVDLTLRPDKVLELTLADPDGLFDIKNDIQLAINGVPTDFYGFLKLFNIVATPTQAVLRIGPVPPTLPRVELKIAVRDHEGQTGGDKIYLP